MLRRLWVAITSMVWVLDLKKCEVSMKQSRGDDGLRFHYIIPDKERVGFRTRVKGCAI